MQRPEVLQHLPKAISFFPFHDRVLVKRIEVAEQPQDGIVIPESMVPSPLEGIVWAVGPGRYDIAGTWVEPSAGVGDQVLFGEHAGNEILVDGETYLLLRDEELLGRRSHNPTIQPVE